MVITTTTTTTKSPPVWEFKHLSGRFKRGDETSLVYIREDQALTILREVQSMPNLFIIRY